MSLFLLIVHGHFRWLHYQSRFGCTESVPQKSPVEQCFQVALFKKWLDWCSESSRTARQLNLLTFSKNAKNALVLINGTMDAVFFQKHEHSACHPKVTMKLFCYSKSQLFTAQIHSVKQKEQMAAREAFCNVLDSMLLLAKQGLPF